MIAKTGGSLSLNMMKEMTDANWNVDGAYLSGVFSSTANIALVNRTLETIEQKMKKKGEVKQPEVSFYDKFSGIMCTDCHTLQRFSKANENYVTEMSEVNPFLLKSQLSVVYAKKAELVPKKEELLGLLKIAMNKLHLYIEAHKRAANIKVAFPPILLPSILEAYENFIEPFQAALTALSADESRTTSPSAAKTVPSSVQVPGQSGEMVASSGEESSQGAVCGENLYDIVAGDEDEDEDEEFEPSTVMLNPFDKHGNKIPFKPPTRLRPLLQTRTPSTPFTEEPTYEEPPKEVEGSPISSRPGLPEELTASRDLSSHGVESTAITSPGFSFQEELSLRLKQQSQKPAPKSPMAASASSVDKKSGGAKETKQPLNELEEKLQARRTKVDSKPEDTNVEPTTQTPPKQPKPAPPTAPKPPPPTAPKPPPKTSSTVTALKRQPLPESSVDKREGAAGTSSGSSQQSGALIPLEVKLEETKVTFLENELRELVGMLQLKPTDSGITSRLGQVQIALAESKKKLQDLEGKK